PQGERSPSQYGWRSASPGRRLQQSDSETESRGGGEESRRAFRRRPNKSRPLQSVRGLQSALHFHHPARRADAAAEERDHHALSAGRSGPPRALERQAPKESDSVPDGRFGRPL